MRRSPPPPGTTPGPGCPRRAPWRTGTGGGGSWLIVVTRTATGLAEQRGDIRVRPNALLDSRSHRGRGQVAASSFGERGVRAGEVVVHVMQRHVLNHGDARCPRSGRMNGAESMAMLSPSQHQIARSSSRNPSPCAYSSINGNLAVRQPNWDAIAAMLVIVARCPSSDCQACKAAPVAECMKLSADCSKGMRSRA